MYILVSTKITDFKRNVPYFSFNISKPVITEDDHDSDRWCLTFTTDCYFKPFQLWSQQFQILT